MATEPIVDHRARWSLPRGRVLLRALRSDPIQDYLLYIPASASPGAPVMVSVHGVTRNAFAQARRFSALCEDRGVVLVAPIFSAEHSTQYQRLGRREQASRVDLVLHRCLSEVASLSGAEVTRTYLFGFSAGAQFAHRYVMAHPHRVARAVVAAAGWYTHPDPGRRYPYGIRPSRSLAGVHLDPEQFLRVPVDVLVGDSDVGSSNLRTGKRLEAQQGATRLQRARSWVAAMRAAAVSYGLEPATTLTEVPGIGHSFDAFCTRGALVEHVGRALFADLPAAAGAGAAHAGTRRRHATAPAMAAGASA